MSLRRTFANALFLILTVPLAMCSRYQAYAAPLPEPSVTTVTVSGVVRAPDGVPVPGAAVQIFDAALSPQPDPAVTDAAGHYTLSAAPYTQPKLVVRAPGHPVILLPDLDLDDRSTSRDIQLPQKGQLSGEVVDEHNRPAAGARLTLLTQVQVRSPRPIDVVLEELVTGPDGGFSCAVTPPGYLLLRAEKSGHARAPEQVIFLREGGTRSDLTLRLRKAHFLAGYVRDEAGRPYPGTTVTLRLMNNGEHLHLTTGTDVAGRFRFGEIPEGKYSVSVSREDLYRQLYVDSGREDVELVLKSRGESMSVAARVVDAATSRAVTDYTVTPAGSGMRVEKDAAYPGQFLIRNVPNTNRLITLSAPGYTTRTLELPLAQSEREQVQVYLMGPGGGITGRAVRSGSGEPLAGVRVVLHGEKERWMVHGLRPLATAVTDAEGRFRLTGVEPGKHQLSIRPEEPLVTRHVVVEAAHGGTADLGDVELGFGGSLGGRVVLSPGDSPVPGVKVLLWHRDQRGYPAGRETTTDRDGAFLFSGLEPDSYELTEYETRSAAKEVRLRDGETTAVVLRIGTAVLKGVVMVRTKPLGGAQLALYPENGGVRSTTADGEGRFVFEHVLPGRAKVNLWGGPPLQGEETVDLPPGQTVERVIYMETGQLKGRVVDPDGKAVGGARVIMKRRNKAGEWENYRDWKLSAEGTWHSIKIPDGDYQVTAEGEGYEPSEAYAFTIVHGAVHPEEATLRLKRAGR